MPATSAGMTLEEIIRSDRNVLQSDLRRGRIAGEGRLGLRARQQTECDDVRDHQHGHVDDRDR